MARRRRHREENCLSQAAAAWLRQPTRMFSFMEPADENVSFMARRTGPQQRICFSQAAAARLPRHSCGTAAANHEKVSSMARRTWPQQKNCFSQAAAAKLTRQGCGNPRERFPSFNQPTRTFSSWRNKPNTKMTRKTPSSLCFHRHNFSCRQPCYFLDRHGIFIFAIPRQNSRVSESWHNRSKKNGTVSVVPSDAPLLSRSQVRLLAII